jgi:glycosyltransferase involved in cell wall biosynthesis
MKILVLTFYYPPDLCAGSFRMGGLMPELRKALADGDVVDVFTTRPNRYSTYQVESQAVEIDGPCTIHRVAIPGHRSGLVDQALSFSVFFLKVLWGTRGRRYDLVFATSSRLFTGFLGRVIAGLKMAPFYLDLRDIFVDTMESLYSRTVYRFVLPVLRCIEASTVLAASRLNLVSPGFRTYFESRYPVPLSFFSNGVDEEFLALEVVGEKPPDETVEPRLVTYAGNVGDGQGLHKILPGIARLRPEIRFRVIGDGGARDRLQREVGDLPNVELLSPVGRERLIRYYQESDALLLHLNDQDSLTRVLPSKVFEYAAVGKPILAGVAGYSKEFLAQHLPDVLVFRPGNAEDLHQRFGDLRQPDPASRDDFLQRFSRSKIMGNMAREILSTGRGPG